MAQRSRDLHDERRNLAHHRYALVEGDRSLLRERLPPQREPRHFGGVSAFCRFFSYFNRLSVANLFTFLSFTTESLSPPSVLRSLPDVSSVVALFLRHLLQQPRLSHCGRYRPIFTTHKHRKFNRLTHSLKTTSSKSKLIAQKLDRFIRGGGIVKTLDFHNFSAA